jgi:hypothetical protein
MQNPYSTAPTAIPPALASLLNMGSSSAPSMAPTPAAGLSGGMASQQSFVPSYQAGGMIGAGGMPEPMNAGLAPQGQAGQAGQTPMSPQMLEMNINQFANQHPQQVAQIRQAVMQGLQSGELTQQELNMMVQLATVAAQNPEMYSYVRNFAIQQGIATEQDIPPEYDQGLIFTMLLIGRSMQANVGGQDMMQGGSAAMAGGPAVTAPQVSSGAIPSMAKGGMTPDSKKADGSVLINAHEGEYVIPANVVKMKGKEFFDSLVEKYRENK